MKALTFKRCGQSPEIGFSDLPRPTLKADVVKCQRPATTGSDLAGVVVEVGSHVTRFKLGDAVVANIFDLGTGSSAGFAVVPEAAAALKPAHLDFVQMR